MEHREFLIKKSQNFTAFVKTLNPDDNLQLLLKQLSPDNIQSMLGIAVIFLKMKGIDVVIDELRGRLTADDTQIEKLRRYFRMFCDIYDRTF